MRKMSMEWHRECLRNRIKSFKKKQEELAYLESELERMKDEIVFYDAQIERATKEKRDGFDAEKFNQPKETP